MRTLLNITLYAYYLSCILLYGTEDSDNYPIQN